MQEPLAQYGSNFVFFVLLHRCAGVSTVIYNHLVVISALARSSSAERGPRTGNGPLAENPSPSYTARPSSQYFLEDSVRGLSCFWKVIHHSSLFAPLALYRYWCRGSESGSTQPVLVESIKQIFFRRLELSSYQNVCKPCSTLHLAMFIRAKFFMRKRKDGRCCDEKGGRGGG